ncbi:MAG: peroxiredoxin-like family protein [Chitinophagaceae bacterium]
MKLFLPLLLFTFSFFTSFAQDKPEGLFINSKAPDFKGKDQNGKEISLKDLRKKGPVVIVFYRGFWCPYCNKELSHFQDSLQYLTAKGAQVIAISPENAEGILKTVEKTKASFSILSDKDMKIAKGYGVSFAVDEKTIARYKNAGIDLLANNDQKDKASLPVPAVYIINKDGAITFRYFDADYRKRVSVKDILQEL